MNPLIPTQCPVCSNKIPEIMQDIEEVETVHRILCKGCDTIYFDRKPPYLPIYDINYNKHFFRSGDIRKAGIMAAKLAELCEKNFKRPNILEAGAGNGLTVFLLRTMGYNAFGIDLDEKLSVFLMDQYKIPIITSRFEEFNPPGQYHLIYSSHVIEHCKNPWLFFQKAHDLLVDNGIFYLDTPDTYYHDKQPHRWHHFETRNPFEHCCLLGRVGVTLLARETGFKVMRIDRLDQFMSQQAILVRPKEKTPKKTAPFPGGSL
jgi:2-polyprenyl-3-methyl-5-hydroxy-6-metoxy-1,4-benzoquinol methylase